jgi:glycosyltransferase involved in cell wall biosynthesis
MCVYDLIISSSHCAAKGVGVEEGQMHICYCHAPMRYIWDQYEAYFGGRNRWRLASLGMRLWRERLRKWDLKTAEAVTEFIANSATVAHRIKEYYGREAEIVHPPVDTEQFRPVGGHEGNYYLVVAALVPYKRVDVAVEAFTRMEKPLWIVGEGPERKRLQRMAGPQVRFLGWVDDEELVRIYNACRALIYPGEEDFGITAVEVQACGRPVIALRRGGVVETVRERRTGLFFDQPTPEALCDAVRSLDTTVFDRGVIRAHAERFTSRHCRDELEKKIRKILDRHGV